MARSLFTVFQLRAVPGVLRARSRRAVESLERAMPSGK